MLNIVCYEYKQTEACLYAALNVVLHFVVAC